MVCELHMKENGFLLGKGSVDWKGVSAMLTETGYHGDHWMQIEGAMPKDLDLLTAYKQNKDFLAAHFTPFKS